MPSFIACPICKKNGVIICGSGSIQECPCCGNTARKRLNIPSQITQSGWTTREGVNNYYTLLAKDDALKLFAEKSNAFLIANIGISISNSKKKQHLRTLQIVCMTVAKAKYPFIVDDICSSDDIN